MSRDRGTALLFLMSVILAVGTGGSALAQKKKPAKAAAGDSGAPSPVLERAIKLYDGEDYYSASIELYKVVEGESGDSEASHFSVSL